MASKRGGRRRGGTADGDHEAAPAPPAPPVPDRISRPFAEALRGLRASPAKKAPARGARAARSPADERGGRGVGPTPPAARVAAPAPPAERACDGQGSLTAPVETRPGLAWEDRVAFSQAMSGVRALPPRKSERRAGMEPARVAASESPQARALEEEAALRARARLDALVGAGVRFDVRWDEDGRVEGERAGGQGRALADLRGGRAAAEAQIDLHGLLAEEVERTLGPFLREARARGRRVVRVVHGRGRGSGAGGPVLGDRVVEALSKGSLAASVAAFLTAARDQGGDGALLVRLADR